MQPSKFLTEKYEQLILESKLEQEARKDLIQKFLKFAIDSLKIQKTPQVIFKHSEGYAKQIHSFGQFFPGENKIVIVASNRNLADIFRTLAHELVHCLQMEEGRLSANNAMIVGKDGSEIENEANSKAAIIMREFGRSHPDIFE